MQDGKATEEARSGCRDIDGEHDLQLRLLAAFRRAASDAHGDAVATAEILDRLTEYTKVHFASEQLLMRLYSYPQYAEHADDHEAAMQQLQALLQAHRGGERRVAADAAERLAQSLTAHIQAADRALGRYLLQLGRG